MEQLDDPSKAVREIGGRMEAIARAEEERSTKAKAAYEAQVARSGPAPMQASTASAGRRSTDAYIVTTRGVPGH
jgi:hypothetical protein